MSKGYLSYSSFSDPVSIILMLDEEAQIAFDKIEEDEENGKFAPSITGGLEDEDDDDYDGDTGIGDFLDSDKGTIDYLDLAAEEMADADLDVEGYGDLIDIVMGIEADSEEEE